MLATWLSTLFGEAATSCFFCGWVMTAESSSQNSPVLIAPPILPACLPANQHFIKQVQETNVYRVKPLSHSTAILLGVLLLTPLAIRCHPSACPGQGVLEDT